MSEHPVIHADLWHQVEATSDERLAALHAAYAEAKAASEAAAERLKAITDGIKAALAAAAPDGAHKIALVGPAGPPLQLVHSERWSVDSKRLKRDEPETYVRYARKSETWTLSVVKGGESA